MKAIRTVQINLKAWSIKCEIENREVEIGKDGGKEVVGERIV